MIRCLFGIPNTAGWNSVEAELFFSAWQSPDIFYLIVTVQLWSLEIFTLLHYLKASSSEAQASNIYGEGRSIEEQFDEAGIKIPV